MVATTTPQPRKLDLSWRIGSTELQLCALTGAEPSLDATSISDVEFRVKASDGTLALQLNKTTAGITIPDATPPAAIIEVTLAQVAALTVGASYTYGVRLWTTDGRRYEQQFGSITISTSVFADEDDPAPGAGGGLSTDMTGDNLWQATT